jgi:uncharacterized protein
MQLAYLAAAILLSVVTAKDPTARVHDFAGLLTPQQRASLEDLSRSVENRTTAQLAVVTVPSLDGMDVDDYATELFNTWGIGQKKFNNGVLLLVAPNERRATIRTGRGIEELLPDSLCGAVLDQFAIPRFRNGDYPGGIVATAHRVAELVMADPAAARGDPNSGPALARRKTHNAFWANGAAAAAAFGLFVLGIAAAFRRLYSTIAFFTVTAISALLLGLAAWFTFNAPARNEPMAIFGGVALASFGAWILNLFRYRRFGPHGCSKCGARLELLSEQDDNPKLLPVQRLEEQIGSVDYDVWFCHACLNQDTERYVKTFSGYTDCPECNGRTFKEDAPETLRPATRLSTGQARVDGRCVFCNHKDVRYIVLPQLPDPSTSNSSSFGNSGSSGGSFGGFSGGGGSSGGGFGGGSTGGGGASRGW